MERKFLFTLLTLDARRDVIPQKKRDPNSLFCMSLINCTPTGEIRSIVGECRKGFNQGIVHTVEQRKTAIREVIRLIDENEEALVQAVTKDLRRASFETKFMELDFVRNEAYGALDNMVSWIKATKAEKDGIMVLEDCVIEHDPLGTVLIIGAWNYPIQLTLVALVGALAGGNTVVIKPSEVSANTAQLISELIPKYLAAQICGVVNGGISETTTLLEERFDHILYTGNSSVAKIVMTAAAKHLTPVTLELGGKSPTVVDDTCDLKIAAQRIMWGRFVNAGQTCIAPDYILAKSNIKSALIQQLGIAAGKFLGPNPKDCPDYGRIVNDMHYKRVQALMSGGKIVYGGECDAATKFIAPTILDDVKLDSPLMTDEIFGPLLPVIPFETVNDVIQFINQREKPLAFYIFSTDAKFYDAVINRTSSGAVVVNDTLMHAGVESLPFGGVGYSGMGSYHGKHTFEMFTHKKSVMRRKLVLESANKLRYPPYSEKHYNILNNLMIRYREARWFNIPGMGWFRSKKASSTTLRSTETSGQVTDEKK